MAQYKAISITSRAPAAQGSRTMSVLIPLTLMGVLCAGISLLFLQGQSLRLDEAQSLWQSGRSAFGIITIVAQDVHVPLYHELLHFWRLFVGDSVASARGLSLLFFILSIPAIYVLGASAYNRRVGLFGALLLSVSPFMNWYGNEIRMYTLLTFFVILNQLFFLRIIQQKERPWRFWVGYFVTALFGMYAHYLFAVNLAAQAFFYLLYHRSFPKGSLKKFISVAILLALAFVPWVYYVWAQGEIGFQEPLLPRPTTVDLFNSFSQFLFGFQDDAINTVLLSLWPIALLFAFLTLRKKRDMSLETSYFLTTLLFSVGLMFFTSILLRPIFISRYLIFVVPSLYLLLASLFESYTPRVRAFASTGLFCLMAVTLAIEIGSAATPVKENYEEAVSYLNAHAMPQDVVVVSAPFTLYPVEYYYRGDAPVSTIPLWNQYAYGPIPPFDPSQLSTQVDQITGAHQNAWVLLSYNQGYENTVKSYFENHYQLLFTKSFSDDLTLYEFKLRYDTPLSQASSTDTN